MKKESKEFKAFMWDLHDASKWTEPIYPAAVITRDKDGNRIETPRSEEHTGWNNHLMYRNEIDMVICTFSAKLSNAERRMLSKLMDRDILNLWFNSDPPKVEFSINCSDVFAWGCSDSEDISQEDLPKLFEYCFDSKGKYKRYSDTAYVCILRNEQPQKPVKENMIKAGAWTTELDSLPKNYYDESFKKELEEKFLTK